MASINVSCKENLLCFHDSGDIVLVAVFPVDLGVLAVPARYRGILALNCINQLCSNSLYGQRSKDFRMIESESDNNPHHNISVDVPPFYRILVSEIEFVVQSFSKISALSYYGI